MCEKCEGTGLVYNEGAYGWDAGGYAPCDCPKGQAELEVMQKAYEES